MTAAQFKTPAVRIMERVELGMAQGRCECPGTGNGGGAAHAVDSPSGRRHTMGHAALRKHQ